MTEAELRTICHKRGFRSPSDWALQLRKARADFRLRSKGAESEERVRLEQLIKDLDQIEHDYGLNHH